MDDVEFMWFLKRNSGKEIFQTGRDKMKQIEAETPHHSRPRIAPAKVHASVDDICSIQTYGGQIQSTDNMADT